MDAKRRILMVDDDIAFVKLMKARLESHGYEVDVAYDGEQGLAKAKASPPDLLILDVVMPKLDGFTFVRRLKAVDGLDRLPILVLTAQDLMTDLFKIEGVRDYIVKPIKDETEILAKIRAHLEPEPTH